MRFCSSASIQDVLLDAPEQPRTLSIFEQWLRDVRGGEIIISAQGNPAALTDRVHDWGGKVFHDATSIRFADKQLLPYLVRR
jgi:hypothetical protein